MLEKSDELDLIAPVHKRMTILKEKPENFEELKELASNGDAVSQYKLGYYYEPRHHSRENDLIKAFDYYIASAENGNKKAKARIYKCSMNRDVIESSIRIKIIEFYKKMISNHETKHYFAHCCATGFGVKRDMNKAFQLFLELANEGDPLAQRTVGNLYDRGQHNTKPGKKLKPDYENAFHWYKKAGEQNDPPAQFVLSKYYESGKKCVKKNLKESIFWCEKAAKLGYVDAQNRMSEFYESGHMQCW
jgi:TPR repeat protein